MLAIERLLRLRHLPILMLIGLAVMAVGGALDVVLHFGPAQGHAHDGFVSEHLAHLVGISGMSLVLAGVVIHGVRRQRRRPAVQQGGLDSHAHR